MASELRPQRILVVEDDVGIASAVTRMLQNAGYQAAVASDGADALEWVTDTMPDGAIVDVQLPKLDGIEFCRRVRAAGLDLGLIVMSAEDPGAWRSEAIAAGADHCLPKPFGIEELTAAVASVCGSQAHETGVGEVEA
jgi:DNA-binding response OmpR family regulator